MKARTFCIKPNKLKEYELLFVKNTEHRSHKHSTSACSIHMNSAQPHTTHKNTKGLRKRATYMHNIKMGCCTSFHYHYQMSQVTLRE